MTTLQRTRETKGMSIAEVAEAIGCSRQTLYTLESGKGDPMLRTARKLAELFETTVTELFPVEDR